VVGSTGYAHPTPIVWSQLQPAGHSLATVQVLSMIWQWFVVEGVQPQPPSTISTGWGAGKPPAVPPLGGTGAPPVQKHIGESSVHLNPSPQSASAAHGSDARGWHDDVVGAGGQTGAGGSGHTSPALHA
jgi:hypothetical protein